MGETTEPMRLWDQVWQTDPKHTKGFKRGGGFSGTATCALYNVRRATELFGPCGIGWGYEEVEHVVAERVWFSRVRLWYILDGTRGEVEHWGGTEIVSQRKSGAFIDDEAAKKSLTDALSKCFSMLGFCADIHMGLYDDSKYMAELKHKFSEEPPSLPDDVVQRLLNSLDMAGISQDDRQAILQKESVGSLNLVSRKTADTVIARCTELIEGQSQEQGGR